MTRIPVSEAEKYNLPFSRQTLYQFHSEGKHKRLVYKVGGKLFFDLDEWEKMAEEAKNKGTLQEG